MSKQMHLLSFLTHSPINHTTLSWADPKDQRIAGFRDLNYWMNLARSLERGLFDGAFFADTLGGFEHYRERFHEAMQYAVWWPTHDPMPLMSVMAAATKHLGLAATLSLSGTHPYLAVRTFGTLDNLTNGRIGWNIVTGNLRGEHRALGHEQMDHDERYERAEEYMALCQKFWSGVPPEAVMVDRAKGIFADPDQITLVKHDGKYFRSNTAPPTFPSPQGRPVLFQAGSSGRGQKFAVRWADAVFCIQPNAAAIKKLRLSLEEAAAGEAPVRLTAGLHVVLGGTEAEAQRKYRELVDRIPIEAALTRLSGSLGVDFSKFELDKPLQEMYTDASQGLMKSAMIAVAGGEATLREASLRWAVAAGCPPVVGTPEQVAAKMEAMWRESGCYGFNITPSVTPEYVDDFVDQVVPLLQARGIFRREYKGKTFRDNLLEE